MAFQALNNNCICLFNTLNNFHNIQKLFNDISKSELEDFDIILFEQGNSNNEIPTIRFSIQDIPEKFVTNFLKPKQCWDYFPLWAIKHKYKYYWVVEDFVHYSGNWRELFNKYKDQNSDLLTRIGGHGKNWGWWNRPRNLYGTKEKGYPRNTGKYQTAFLSFSRFSRDLVEKGYDSLNSGKKAFLEIFWSTVCLKNGLISKGFEPEDIGSYCWKPDGEYVKVESKNKLWYPVKKVENVISRIHHFKPKIVIMRILGNDLEGLHGSHQTITNLEFTIKYEESFLNTDKVYLLNRIYSEQVKMNIIGILKRHNIKYIDIPFTQNEYNELPHININKDEFKALNRTEKVQLLYKHNLYLINNNGSRNQCIKYGKSNGYDYIFALDSNNFLLKAEFESILNCMLINEPEYIVINQRRLADNKYTNDTFMQDSSIVNNLPIQEPQICFHKSAKYEFNDKLPYGVNPKAELINALNIPGEWNKWKNFYGVNVQQRLLHNVKVQRIGNIVRLSPFNENNNRKSNWENRYIGLYNLIRYIDTSHTITGVLH